MTQQKTLTGRHVLLIFGAFFLTIIGVNVLMATLAVKTFSGEDVKGAYVKGLAYNETIAQAEAEARSGYAGVIKAERGAGGAVALDVALTRDGAAVRDVAATARMRHPTNAYLDRSVELTEGVEGHRVASVDGLQAGRWDIEIIVSRDGAEVYRMRDQLWLP